MDKIRVRSLAGKGAAAALVATMAFGSMPVTALAQTQAPSLLDLVLGRAVGWQSGHTYEMPLSVWMNNQVDGATVNMTRYYSTTGKLVVSDSGALDFQFTILAPDKFQGLQYGGKDVQPDMVDGHAVYHIPVSSGELNNATGIETRMRIDAMGGWFTMNIRTDVDKAEDKTPAEPEAVDKSKLNAAIASAKAVEQGSKTDEAYKALQSAISAAQKVADDVSASQDDVDGATGTLDSAVKAFKASADKPSEDKPGEDEKADKSKLDEAIASAKAVEQGSKTDEAYKALTDAVVAAQKVADDEGASQADVDAALSALDKAVEAFKASADKPSEDKPGENPDTPDDPDEDKPADGAITVDSMQVGHLYELPVSIMKYADPSEPSMSADYFSKAAVVVKKADGSFKVRITTNRTDYIEGVQYGLGNPGSPTDPAGTDAKDLGGGSYELVVSGVDEPAPVAFKVAPMNHVWATALLKLDTSSIKDLDKTDDGSAPDASQGSDDDGNGAGTNGGTTNTGTVKPATKPATTTTKKTTTTTAKTSTSTKKLPQTSDPGSVASAVGLAIGGIVALGSGVVARLRNGREDA